MTETVKIGNVSIDMTAVLAPMAGVADRAYRLICKDFRASYCVSEMVSAKGICYSDRKTAQLCTITQPERPMGIQLFGSEPEFMAEAVGIVLEYKPDIIDINMGCPVQKVIKTGAGSALMRDVGLAYKVTESAVKSAGEVPVTVKIRSGWDGENKNAVEVARAVESAGASGVTVHGRTKDMLYSGKADWSIIKEVKNAVKIPVIGNGDVTGAESCLEMYEETGCDLVMIGRGSYGNPFIFGEISAKIRGVDYRKPTVEEKMEVMLRHIKLILDLSEKPENLAMHEARKYASWYMNGFYGCAKFRGECYKLTSFEDARRLAEEFVDLQRSIV